MVALDKPFVTLDRMPQERHPSRKRLHHDIPDWVEDGALFFVTVNCSDRGFPQLTQQDVATALIDAVRFYHDQGKWQIRLFLIMPDHWHAIFSLHRELGLAQTLKAWKRYTARSTGVRWQDGFFDHRLRNDGEVAEKFHYVLTNPVRAMLCDQAEDWPHRLRWTPEGLIAGIG